MARRQGAHPACSFGRLPLAGGREFKNRVNQKVEPWPSRLSTPIVPPIISTSCLQIASPSPVPPYLRVVDASAWTNGANSAATWSGRIPIPVSVTVKRTVAAPSRLALAAPLPDVTSPRSVNLMALPSRDWSTPGAGGGRRRAGAAEFPATRAKRKSSPFASRLHAQELDHVLDSVAQVEAQILKGDLPRLDLGKVQDIVDEGQQSPPAVLGHLGVSPLLRGQVRFQQQLQPCR